MRDNPVKTIYSNDGEFRYEIVSREDGLFQVWVQKKIVVDDYFGKEKFVWCDIKDYAHIADNLERADEIGNEALLNLTGA